MGAIISESMGGLPRNQQGSPLQGKIAIAPKRDAALATIVAQGAWRISTAVVVDGILRLFSSNPKRDANLMRTPTARPRDVLRSGARDRSPLRDVYIDGNDTLVYKLVENYLTACKGLFWDRAREGSYIQKTVGVQALFDIMRKLSAGAIESLDISVAYFEEKLAPASVIDFATAEFKVPAGSGRSAIRRAIEAELGV